MRLVTFDPFRAIGCPGIYYLKPDLLMKHLDIIQAADFILFPDYADINLLAHAVGKRIFPGLPSYYLGYDKVEMTRAFQAAFPVHVPPTLILPNTWENRTRIMDEMYFPFVAKLPRSTRGEGVFLVENEEDWLAYCAKTGVLYTQEKLDIDRDLRIVWIGDQIVHAYWRVAAHGEFHNNIAHGGHIELNDIPQSALTLVEKLATTFNIDYAGFDIAMYGDHPYVFEFNRLFGLEGLNRAGINTGTLIYNYLHKSFNPDMSGTPVLDKILS